jgi:Tol biopolymer transport system component
VRRQALLPWLGLGLACALGGVPERELPEEPIAFTYRTQEEARRRAEDYQDDLALRSERPGPTQARQSRSGRNDLVASDENMGEIFSRLLGIGNGREDDQHLGRLALLYPRTGKLEVVAAARRGSIPLAWSDDHQRLLFSQPSGTNLQLFEYSRANGTVRGLTFGSTAHTQACYGPEGRIVVAAVDTREKPLRSHIAISGPGGRGPFTVLTKGPNDHSPACLPNGLGIAFVREDVPPRAEIYFLEGEELRRLSRGRHPRFSPDGEWLAFAAPMKRELRIWRIRPDGSGRARIGRGMRHEARPTVSPDGRLVAYVAAEERPRRHLYLRRFDGTGDRILFADGDGEFPVW